MGATEEVKQSSFERLAALNVNAKLEKKGNLSYLSWAWAWDQLMRQDPNAEFEYGEPKMFGETMMVYCTVRAFEKSRTAHLPVMDHRNKPIANPDAFQVNTAMQRCLVKAIGLHGLGLYIYAGEDLPDGDKPETGPKHTPLSGAGDDLNAEERKKVESIASKCIDWINSGSIADAVCEKDNAGLNTEETLFFWTFFDSKQKTAMKKEFDRQKQARLKAEEATQP